jgi:hypothetical protein
LITLPLSADDEHLIFVTAAMAAGEEGSPVKVTEVISHMEHLFGVYEFYDGRETEYDYVIDTSDAIPNEPGRTRDRMWRWIERTGKKLHQEVDVEGARGEYIYLVGGDWVLTESDFDADKDGNAVIEGELAERICTLLKFRAEWLKFAMKLRNKRRRGHGVP